MSDAPTAQHKHPYHLVDPSPWPAVGAMAALILAAGALMFMHHKPWGGMVMGLGLASVIGTMFFWWRDVVREAEHEGHHSKVVQIGLRYGMVLFIASEVMFFVAFFWGFFHNALFPMDAIENVWPPKGTKTFDPFELPFLNTLILLCSGTTVTWAHHALLHGDRKGLVQGLALTVALGVSFTALQAFEYAHAGFSFGENVYSSAFFMATGFHGFHVIVGTIFLAICLIRAMDGHFKPDHHFGFEAAAWYWHFVDVVWLFLFCVIYWWGS